MTTIILMNAVRIAHDMGNTTAAYVYARMLGRHARDIQRHVATAYGQIMLDRHFPGLFD